MIIDHDADNAEDDEDYDDDVDNADYVRKRSPSPNQKGQTLVPVNKTSQLSIWLISDHRNHRNCCHLQKGFDQYKTHPSPFHRPLKDARNHG